MVTCEKCRKGQMKIRANRKTLWCGWCGNEKPYYPDDFPDSCFVPIESMLK